MNLQNSIKASAQTLVNGIDLSRQEQRVCEEGKIKSAELITRSITEYRRFLILSVVYPEQILIPQTLETDEVWHAHILYTQQYMEDCNALFGEYLHHEPGVGDMPIDLYRETIHIYQSLFHEMPQGTLWTEIADH